MAKVDSTRKPTPSTKAASTSVAQPDSATASPAQLEQGTYEIIRNRLQSHSVELTKRLSQLNDSRRAVFGAIPTKLLATERVTTANNCIPSDIFSIGDRFLFGYNVHIGLKSETALEDVFSVFQFNNQAFHECGMQLLSDGNFQADFKQLYKYYKGTRFARFHWASPHLYFVFQVGKSANDVKAFKWVRIDDTLKYIDARSEHEIRFPPQHDFQWTRTHRDLHRAGIHPHVSIIDVLFVETIGGDLTLKVEDNTDVGTGIYSEPVDDPDQGLDDAEIFYASVGNIILLKIRPFKEHEFRYFVFNRKIQTIQRLDSIGQACVLLPEDHGLIFANGYYLQTGDHKIFESDVRNLQFERRVPASNGEDHLYAFYNPTNGEYVLLSYNMIEQRVETPIQCHGYSFFDNGQLVFFKSDSTPQKHHALQIWQTPYVAADQISAVNVDSMLYKIGNRDIVRAMAGCHEIINLTAKDDAYAGLYLDLVKKCTDILDAYFWLNESSAFALGEVLQQIRDSAKSAVDEFDKVVRVRQTTRQQFQQTQSAVAEAIRQSTLRRYQAIDDYVKSLADLRGLRGQLVSLRELKYVDLPAIDLLEKGVQENAQKLAQKCVDFLAQPASLSPYEIRVNEHRAAIPAVSTAAAGRQLDEKLAGSSRELDLLIEIVSNLKIDDATQRTKIIDGVSAIYTNINQTRATLKNKLKELFATEGAAEFSAQLKLLGQAVVNYLDACDKPEKCDEHLTKMMVQVEELEGRFGEFDDFVVQLAEKREEVYSAFETKKLQLVEARNRRATALMSAAERILNGIRSRVSTFQSVDEINGYFAGDLMIEKVREIVEQLRQLEETVKVDDLQGRLKTVREDALRQLRDKKELFVEGQNLIQFGKHRFTVNVQPLDLTTLVKDDRMLFHLTGTKYFEHVESAELKELREFWDQELVSENKSVYRGEYLADRFFQIAKQPNASVNVAELATKPIGELTSMVQQFMAPRYREGYVKGVHDQDAALILSSLAQMHGSLGLLRFSAAARALAMLFQHSRDWTDKQSFLVRIESLNQAAKLFGSCSGRERVIAELKQEIEAFRDSSELQLDVQITFAAEYLFEAIAAKSCFATHASLLLVSDLHYQLSEKQLAQTFADSMNVGSLKQRFEIAGDWLRGFSLTRKITVDNDTIVEAAAILACKIPADKTIPLSGEGTKTLGGMLGEHPRLQTGNYHLNYNEFRQRLSRYQDEGIPKYNRLHELKSGLLQTRKAELKLDEFKPKVLTSFVRNKLINDVYLPLIGNNLAKQMGSAGEQKRTDLMGLLLLISPPGYGKTTLMEYIANRLGLTFVKINGPAIGHRVSSLDPVEAPNASAREEVQRLNLSLEMGDNIMIYVDDIQHCNPEFLQKFISLCDATRKIEGVFQGRTRTYDLRGRKVCVVMAGNPYTESGEKFQIPDMLANRADTYNLGDVIGENLKTFELSYLENALTSNSALHRLNSGHRNDILSLIKMAEQDTPQQTTLEGTFSVEEINEMVNVLRKLLRIRTVLLQVNRHYIDSAAQSDAYRTEPAFRLQGSYRDMNKLAERVVPVMNDAELNGLIESHYENQAQTLTTGAESNLLKFRELMSSQTEQQRQRWDEIKRTYKRNLVLGAAGNDNAAGQVIAQLSTLGDGLAEIRTALDQGIKGLLAGDGKSDSTALEQLTLTQIGQAVNELVKFNSSLSEIKTALAQLMATSQKATAETQAVPPQQIQVVNKVPQAFLEIIRYQFETLQTWLDPITKLSKTLPAAKPLAKSARKAVESYEHIIGELEKKVDEGDES